MLALPLAVVASVAKSIEFSEKDLETEEFVESLREMEDPLHGSQIFNSETDSFQYV